MRANAPECGESEVDKSCPPVIREIGVIRGPEIRNYLSTKGLWISTPFPMVPNGSERFPTVPNGSVRFRPSARRGKLEKIDKIGKAGNMGKGATKKRRLAPARCRNRLQHNDLPIIATCQIFAFRCESLRIVANRCVSLRFVAKLGEVLRSCTGWAWLAAEVVSRQGADGSRSLALSGGGIGIFPAEGRLGLHSPLADRPENGKVLPYSMLTSRGATGTEEDRK